MGFGKTFLVVHGKGFEVFLYTLLSAKADIVWYRIFTFPS
jgi:hypothetical protein